MKFFADSDEPAKFGEFSSMFRGSNKGSFALRNNNNNNNNNKKETKQKQ